MGENGTFALTNNNKQTHTTTMAYGAKKDIERKRQAKKFIIKQLSLATPYQDIVEMLMEKYGYVEKYCQAVITEARKDVEARYDKWLDKIATDNYQRLLVILDETMEKKDYKNALKSIDLLNKLGGAYTEKINISTDNFTIKLDE